MQSHIGIKILTFLIMVHQFVSVLFMYTPAAVFVLVLDCQLSNCVLEYLQLLKDVMVVNCFVRLLSDSRM